MLSGRGLCDGLITRPEESYQLWRVVVRDQETSNEEAKARYGAVKYTTKRVVTPRKQTNKPICYILQSIWLLSIPVTLVVSTIYYGFFDTHT